MSLRVNLTLLLVCATMPAQVAEKPLNNTDVANMIRAGLPEGTVVLAIQRAVARENTQFDASPQALIELRNMGATEPILNFILTAPTVERYEPSTTVAGLPASRGLYFQSPTGWRALDPVLLFPDVETRWKSTWKNFWSWDVARENRRYLVPGRQAGVQIAGPKPALYLRSQTPGSGWLVSRLSAGSDHRELIATVPDVFADQPRITFASGPPITLDRAAAAADVLTLRPTADLSPGEYLVFKVVPGQPWLIEGYTFQIGTT